jgi:DUF2934 family protein
MTETERSNAVKLVPRLDRRRSARQTVTVTDIARRAYELYLRRGCEPGHEVDDWLQAERELKQAEPLTLVDESPRRAPLDAMEE